MKLGAILGIILVVVVFGAVMADAITDVATPSSVSNDSSALLVYLLKGFAWMLVLGIIAIGLVFGRLRKG